jgi:hypothetical protein
MDDDILVNVENTDKGESIFKFRKKIIFWPDKYKLMVIFVSLFGTIFFRPGLNYPYNR